MSYILPCNIVSGTQKKADIHTQSTLLRCLGMQSDDSGTLLFSNELEGQSPTIKLRRY